MLFAVIGGTGIDEMDSFTSGIVTSVTTRFGTAEVIEARIGDREVLFVPRHGKGHSVAPDKINYRAQIAALKKRRVDRVIGICAVGSLQKDLAAGSFAVLTDFIDLTRRSARTFFDEPDSPVVHTDFTHPYCPEVSRVLVQSCTKRGARLCSEAVYVGVDGPRYETPAEIRLYSSWGAHVIGMTNVPEVILAREAGLCYGAIAIVTNAATGISPTPLTHAEVRLAMRAAGEDLTAILTSAISDMPEKCECECRFSSLLVI